MIFIMSKYTMNGNINGNIKTESSSSNLSNRLDKIFKNKVRNNFKNIEPLQNIYTEPTKTDTKNKTKTKSKASTKEGFQDTTAEAKSDAEKVLEDFQLKKINKGDLKKKEGWHSLFHNIFYAFPGLLNYFSAKMVNAGDKGHRDHDQKWIKESMIEFCTIFLAIYFAGAMYHKLVIKPQGPIKEYLQSPNKDLNYYLNEWIFIFLLLLPDVFHFIVYDGIKKNIVNRIMERPTICYLLFYMLSFFFCTFFLQNMAELFLDMILFKTNPVIYLFIVLGFFRWVLNMPLKSKVQAMGSSILFLIYLILHFVISMMLGPIAQGAFSIYVMMFFSGGTDYMKELPTGLFGGDTTVKQALDKSAMPDGTFLGMFDYYIHRFIFRTTPLMLTFIFTVFFAYKLIFGLVPPIGLKGKTRMIGFAIANGGALLGMIIGYISSFNYVQTDDKFEMLIRGRKADDDFIRKSKAGIFKDGSGNTFVLKDAEKDKDDPKNRIYKKEAIEHIKEKRKEEWLIRGKKADSVYIFTDDVSGNYVLKDPNKGKNDPENRIYKADAIKRMKDNRQNEEQTEVKKKLTKEKDEFIKNFNNGKITIKTSSLSLNEEPLNTNVLLDIKYNALKEAIEDGKDSIWEGKDINNLQENTQKVKTITRNGPEWKPKPIYDSINEIKDYNVIRKLVYLTGFEPVYINSKEENQKETVYYIHIEGDENDENNNEEIRTKVKFDINKIKSLKNIYNNKKISYSYRQIAYEWAKKHFPSTIQTDETLPLPLPLQKDEEFYKDLMNNIIYLDISNKIKSDDTTNYVDIYKNIENEIKSPNDTGTGIKTTIDTQLKEAGAGEELRNKLYNDLTINILTEEQVRLLLDAKKIKNKKEDPESTELDGVELDIDSDSEIKSQDETRPATPTI